MMKKTLCEQFYVYDNIAIYSLVTAFGPEFNNIAASSYLFFQIMIDHLGTGLKFDFEGSMIENCESSYNKFGSIQTPYFVIKKVNSRKAKLATAIKTIIHELSHSHSK